MNERTTSPDLITWTLHEDTLLAMLSRCHAGESPDEVYMEMYVNLITD